MVESEESPIVESVSVPLLCFRMLGRTFKMNDVLALSGLPSEQLLAEVPQKLKSENLKLLRVVWTDPGTLR